MWYEALPPLMIIGTCFGLSQIIPYYACKWYFGTPIQRRLMSDWDHKMLLRDYKLTGSAWKSTRLDTIPDKK